MIEFLYEEFTYLYYRKDFSQYASKSVEKLRKNIVQTSAALQGNKWLSGAKVTYALLV